MSYIIFHIEIGVLTVFVDRGKTLIIDGQLKKREASASTTSIIAFQAMSSASNLPSWSDESG